MVQPFKCVIKFSQRPYTAHHGSSSTVKLFRLLNSTLKLCRTSVSASYHVIMIVSVKIIRAERSQGMRKVQSEGLGNSVQGHAVNKKPLVDISSFCALFVDITNIYSHKETAVTYRHAKHFSLKYRLTFGSTHSPFWIFFPLFLFDAR